LIDYRIPGLSGIELCVRLKKLPHKVPVIFYSAVDGDSKEAALAAGALHYIVKPGYR
jgi:CheY-like chemotaxis protein